ncbi:MAG: hypothetical protein P8J02_05430 [Yoonia sp.]|nr:hypothetical protein [Yoonia sp.]
MRLIFNLIAVTMLLTSPARAEMNLVMVEEQGCMWCARWNDEIGPIYPKTTEGGRAPLRRIEMTDPIPADLTFDRAPHYTPTFILVNDGVEVSRIEGYPGEDFFWGLLDMMIKQSDATEATEG